MFSPAPSSSPYPLGATVQSNGVNFALQAPHATKVTVCIKEGNSWEMHDLTSRTYGIWHDFIPGVKAGQLYGYRVDGAWDPHQGLWYNPHKFLLDPYTKQIKGTITDITKAQAYHDDSFATPDPHDSLGFVPYGIITDNSIKARSQPLHIPWNETIIYEAHLGSLTAHNPYIPKNIRATYLGACHESVIEHLLKLHITTIEFLPLQACINEPVLLRRKMRNHWGYSTGAFFAPDPQFASTPGAEIAEFAHMVDTFHQHGIEVIMDVVYNHTCESDALGTTISWRGIDALEYYQIDPSGEFINYTGTGNSLDADSPLVVSLITDSLRYWATTMSIDGFRFDLASVLGRGSAQGSPTEDTAFTPRGAALAAIIADPVLRTRKLIAEPWDATMEGYQLGKFEPAWSEWNDKFRDTARTFWIGHSSVAQLATRITGSEDIFGHNNRNPFSSINFITAHDGFTLKDLVSYNSKHNENNGENNADGTDNNHSTNHGYEGETTNSHIIHARKLHQRNLLATLFLSLGTPMLLMGDEMGHSQEGNNNAYCVPENLPAAQSFALDWENLDNDLYKFTQNLIALRSSIPIYQRHTFFTPHIMESDAAEILWFNQHGEPMNDDQWNSNPQTIIMWINTRFTDQSYTHSNHQPLFTAPSACIIFHYGDKTSLTLPVIPDHSHEWILLFDSNSPTGSVDSQLSYSHLRSGQPCKIPGSIVLIYQEKE